MNKIGIFGAISIYSGRTFSKWNTLSQENLPDKKKINSFNLVHLVQDFTNAKVLQ